MLNLVNSWKAFDSTAKRVNWSKSEKEEGRDLRTDTINVYLENHAAKIVIKHYEYNII